MIGAPAPEARLALYWAPAVDDPLHRLGSTWLGRDAESGAPLRQPELPGLDIAALTADPRGYGLHATLKPPFRLAVSWAEAIAAAEALAARTAPFDLPPLAVADLDGFLALRETAPCPALHALADACVVALEPCRAPPGEAELARRRRHGLTPRQDELLPPLRLPACAGAMALPRHPDPPPDRGGKGGGAARRHRLPRRGPGPAAPVTELTLFTQARAGAPFLIAERLALRGAA